MNLWYTTPGIAGPVLSVGVPIVQAMASTKDDDLGFDSLLSDAPVKKAPPEPPSPDALVGSQHVFESLPPNGCIFGGYVRDQLAGKPFADMDLFFEDNASYAAFVQELYKRKYTLKTAARKPYPHDLGCAQMAYTLTDPSGKALFKVDILLKQEERGSPFQGYDKWDADINLLTLRNFNGALSYGRIDMNDRRYDSETYAKTAELKKKAEQGIFEAFVGMEPHRRNKLIDKGYVEKIPAMEVGETKNQGYSVRFSKEEVTKMDGKVEYGMKDEAEKSDSKSKMNVLGVIKQESPDVAYRAAAMQMTKRLQQAAVALLKKQGFKGAKLKVAQEMLEGQMGNIAISIGLGFGMMFLPEGMKGAKVDRLAKEFRVQGEAQGLSGIMDLGLETFLPIVMEGLSSLPSFGEEEQPQLRVGEPKRVDASVAAETVPAPAEESEETFSELLSNV